MDLREWLRPERGRALLDLIEQCPSACRWREAAANDLEVAQDSLAQETGARQQKWAPRVSEYDLTALLLARAVDLLGVVASGKQIKGYRPFPTPRTAADVVRAQQAMESAHDLIAQVAPHAVKD